MKPPSQALSQCRSSLALALDAPSHQAGDVLGLLGMAMDTPTSQRTMEVQNGRGRWEDGDGRGQTPEQGSTRTRHGGAPAPRGSGKPRGEQEGRFIDALTVPKRNSNHFWTQASSSPAGSGMLPVFPISHPCWWVGSPSPGLAGISLVLLLIWSGEAWIHPFGRTPLLARSSWLSILLGTDPSPAKWGQRMGTVPGAP